MIEPIVKTVHLVHYTTQEFFDKIEKTRFPDAQRIIAEACLTYQLLDGIKRENYDFFKISRGLPLALYDYTQKFWVIHLRGEPEEVLKDQALRFLQTGASMSSQWWDFSEPYPLHEAVYRNLATLCGELLAQGQFDINMRFSGTCDYCVLDLACLQGHTSLVELLLRNGANPDLADRVGDTPLHRAASMGYCDIIQRLVRCGSCLDIPNRHGSTPLSFTIRHLDAAKALILGGADVKASRCSGTLMNLAVRKKRVDVITLLLQRGVDVNAKDSAGISALHRIFNCQDMGYRDIKRLLTDNGARIVLSTACQMKSLHLVQEAIGLGSDVNDQDEDHQRTGLHYAAENGCLPIVQLLLTKGVDLETKDGYGRTAISYAFENQHTEVVRTLLYAGSDPTSSDFEGRIAMSFAIKKKKVDMMEALAEFLDPVVIYTFSQDEEEFLLLHLAADAGYDHVVSTLIARGADVNSRGVDGITPLHCAILGGMMSTVRILLSKGADVKCQFVVNASDSDGSAGLLAGLCPLGITPLHMAAHVEEVNIECLGLLLAAGSNVNEQSSSGVTALHFAASRASVEATIFLLSNGADINRSDALGFTPLMYATIAENMPVIELLLDNGADCDPCDHNGRLTALHLAAYGGLDDVARHLIPSSDVFALDIKGRSPCDYAEQNEHANIASSLRRAMETVGKWQRSYSSPSTSCLPSQPRLSCSLEAPSRTRRQSWSGRTSSMETPRRDWRASLLKAKEAQEMMELRHGKPRRDLKAWLWFKEMNENLLKIIELEQAKPVSNSQDWLPKEHKWMIKDSKRMMMKLM